MANKSKQKVRRFRPRTLVIAGVVAAVALAAGGYVVFAAQSSNAPPPVSLSPISPLPSSTTGSGGLDGAWTVVPKDSFVGYRVREKLFVLPAPSDAVGRTSSVTGTMVISGLSLTSATFSADLRSLTSDKQMRDARIHSIGLESDAFPKATFVLTAPVTFDSRPPAGKVAHVTAKGKFTLHGVTREVSVPLQATWGPGQIEVVGSFPVQFADYGITPPTIAGFVSVGSQGTVELKLVLAKR